jgi:hypothetical protein
MPVPPSADEVHSILTDAKDWNDTLTHAQPATESLIFRLSDALRRTLPVDPAPRSRIYVAGPMTGLPDMNYPAFRHATALLEAAGHQVEDPSTNTNPVPDDYHGWLRAGLAQLIRCEAVALLPGWEGSGGARLEVNVAATLGLTVKPLADYLPIDTAF